MSHEDPRGRSERDHGRGAYTPPTDDDLPFNRGYDARRAPSGPSRPPVTLMVSVAVLLALIVVVVLFYRSGLRASEDAPPAVGEPVGELRVEAPVDAQPVDPEAGVSVYADAQTPGPVTFAPPAAEPLPREALPAPTAAPAARAPAGPAPVPARPADPVGEALVRADRAAGTPATGSASVQIGAFGSTAIAEREYAAVASGFPQFASGTGKRVQEVTSSNGQT
ncbi:MAG: SPOR domain-containing protein, partial [Brevundimonas sp.]